MNNSLTTIKITLPQESVDRLNMLQEKMEVDSLAEVLKNAVRIFETVIDETDAGTEFFIKRKGSEIEPLKVFE